MGRMILFFFFLVLDTARLREFLFCSLTYPLFCSCGVWQILMAHKLDDFLSPCNLYCIYIGDLILHQWPVYRPKNLTLIFTCCLIFFSYFLEWNNNNIWTQTNKKIHIIKHYELSEITIIIICYNNINNNNKKKKKRENLDDF